MLKRLIQFTVLLLLSTSQVFAVCTATAPNKGGGTDNGSNGTATVAATIGALGDGVWGSAWCFTTCTYTSVTVGSQTATQVSTGITGTATGIGWLWYIASATVSGSQTITFTASGVHTDIQVSYVDFTPSASCAFSFDKVSSLGTGTGTNATTPSITSTASGEVEYVFTDISTTMGTPGYNAPWTPSTTLSTSNNADGYILSSSGSATANNGVITTAGNWAALMGAFSITASGGVVRHRASVINR
jgi:hypothetical protein